jgi:hypothetical protein
MKRSRSIRLVLIGGLSAGALTSCGPGGIEKAPVSAQNVYTNNFYVPGVGYYHAPFRAFYALRYNHFDPQTQRYFYGGQWATAPCQNFTNISSPTMQVAQQAETQRTDIPRGGFGSSSRTHHVWS